MINTIDTVLFRYIPILLLLLCTCVPGYAQDSIQPILHKVKWGETLFSIARQYKLSTQEIKGWNGMKTDAVTYGDEIIVGPKNYPIKQKEAEKEVKTTETKAPLPKVGSLLFCGGIEEGAPIGVSSIFYKGIGREYIYAFFKQPGGFNISNIKVELFQKNPENGNFEEQVARTAYSVKPKWAYTFFKYSFASPGEYLMVVSSNDSAKLAEGFITILEE